MNRPDDLECLWKTQPLDKSMKGEEMRDLVLKKINAFDRKIRMRNIREIGGAAVVGLFFLFLAWVQHGWIGRLGDLIVVAGALWIIYYIRRYGTEPADPLPDQSETSYRKALALKYEHQIRLLRSVKFWYLLPMYIGLLINTIGLLKEQAQTRQLMWMDAIAPLIYTLIFGGLWWLNEVYAVQKLQRFRTEILSGL